MTTYTETKFEVGQLYLCNRADKISEVVEITAVNGNWLEVAEWKSDGIVVDGKMFKATGERWLPTMDDWVRWEWMRPIGKVR